MGASAAERNARRDRIRAILDRTASARQKIDAIIASEIDGDGELPTLNDLRDAYVVAVIDQCGSISAAAEALGTYRSTLQRIVGRRRRRKPERSGTATVTDPVAHP